jgi:hypothetical protein
MVKEWQQALVIRIILGESDDCLGVEMPLMKVWQRIAKQLKDRRGTDEEVYSI